MIYAGYFYFDLPGGGSEEDSYVLDISKTYEVDVSPLFKDLGEPSSSYDDGDGGGSSEWATERVVRVDSKTFEPRVINPGGRFRYIIRLIGWHPNWSAILRMWLTVGSVERESDPLYVRYGGSVETVYWLGPESRRVKSELANRKRPTQ